MPIAAQTDAHGSFRADIEGLRAIAVLLVVGCHALLPGLSGGFVGVDVFFVISGFLITRLLVAEWRSTGRIDFVAFYARRIRRLAPALLAMLATTSVACAVLLAPWEQVDQAGAIASAALWFSNVRFALADLDYFGPASSTNAVLHTWSLGVEEQFYLVWPAWLLFLMGAWRWQRRRPDPDGLTRALLLCLPLAVALAVVIGMTSTRLAFYMMPARFWQFVVGAVVATVAFDALPWFRRRAGAVAFAGLVLIALSGLAVDAQTTYPGPWTLAPTLGAALVIAAGSAAPVNRLGRALGHRSLRVMGRLSYGWYLWHWPVLVLGATLIPTPGLGGRLVLVVVAFALAAASYRWIEAPLRRSTGEPRPKVAVVVAGLCASIAAFVAVGIWQARLPVWQNRSEQMAIATAREDAPVIYAAGCDVWYASDRVVPCAFGAVDATRTAVVLGDSVALQWFEALQKTFDRPGWRLVVITKSSCPAADIDFVYARIGRRYRECTNWRDTALRALGTQLRPDVVIIGSSAAYPFDRAQWFEGTRSVLLRLRQATPLVHVLRATPLPGFDGPACLSRRLWRPEWLSRPSDCSSPVRATPAAVDGIVDAVRSVPGVRLIDLTAAVCPGGRCAAERDGRVVFRDGQHVASGFARSLAPQMSAALAGSIAAVEAQSAASRR